MKIRSGFVSNSSSSSFLITGKDNISKAIDLINKCKEGYFDYYLINSRLYTNAIHDSYDFYDEIGELAVDEFEHHGAPYDDEKEVEGDRGVTTVYVPKYEFKQEGEDSRRIKDELYSLCKKWIYNNDLFYYSDIEREANEKSDIIDSMIELVQQIYNLVGYNREEVKK